LFFEDFSELKETIAKENGSLLTRNKDDIEIEHILLDIIQSDKIEQYGLVLSKSHLRAF
jgi:hypothetical protein